MLSSRALRPLRSPHLFSSLSFLALLALSLLRSPALTIWRPALPLTWMYWTALVHTLPLWAALQLAHAGLTHHLGKRKRYVLLGGPEAEWEDAPARRGTGWLGAYAFLVLLGIVGMCTSEPAEDTRFRPIVQYAQAHPRPEGYGKQEKLFIAALFHNNEAVLPGWSAALLGAIPYFGAANVYVSIVESGSADASPALLDDLADKLTALHVPHRVLTGAAQVAPPAALEWEPRIAFLAALRNQALEPLTSGDIGSAWDRVVFSNDVLLTAEDWVELVETAGGAYDMACALDFNHFGLYDAWVTRSRTGALVSSMYPFFPDAPSRRALRAGEPVRVFSCWNGLASIRAEPFLSPAQRLNASIPEEPLGYPLVESHPWAGRPELAFHNPNTHDADGGDWEGEGGAHSGLGRGALTRGGRRVESPRAAPALRFRASTRGECFSSESFLVPYDLRRVFGMERVYVNGRVIVAYNQAYYTYFKYTLRHWAVRWLVEGAWAGWGMLDARTIIGNEEDVWRWDGGDCQPWW